GRLLCIPCLQSCGSSIFISTPSAISEQSRASLWVASLGLAGDISSGRHCAYAGAGFSHSIRALDRNLCSAPRAPRRESGVVPGAWHFQVPDRDSDRVASSGLATLAVVLWLCSKFNRMHFALIRYGWSQPDESIYQNADIDERASFVSRTNSPMAFFPTICPISEDWFAESAVPASRRALCNYLQWRAGVAATCKARMLFCWASRQSAW